MAYTLLLNGFMHMTAAVIGNSLLNFGCGLVSLFFRGCVSYFLGLLIRCYYVVGFYLFVTLLLGQLSLSLFFRFTYMTTIEKFSLLRGRYVLV